MKIPAKTQEQNPCLLMQFVNASICYKNKHGTKVQKCFLRCTEVRLDSSCELMKQSFLGNHGYFVL